MALIYPPSVHWKFHRITFATSSTIHYMYRLCVTKDMFMDVECSWPGNVHDSKVFANSSINKMFRNGKIPATFQTVIPGCEKVPNYLIGDPSYPLTPFCMKEFDNCNSDEEVILNNMLRSTRNQIRCLFGRLNARWANTYQENGFEIRNTTNCRLCLFYFA